MLNQQKYLMLIFGAIVLTGCHAPNTPSNSTITQQSSGDTSHVYVASIPSKTSIGDASITTGTLTVNNNCLYVNDYLVVFQTPNVTWQQNPFSIVNNNQEKIGVGSKVMLGGSVAQYKHIKNSNLAEWLASLPKDCNTKKFWFANSINLAKN